MTTIILPPTRIDIDTFSGTWTVPANVRQIMVEAIGEGATGSTNGGGGGAYAKVNLLNVTPGQIIYYQCVAYQQVATEGFDTWLNTQINEPPNDKSLGLVAKGGATGLNGGAGGKASECIGDVVYSGGNGGIGTGSTGGNGGGGGAAGPNGPGANGGNGFNSTVDGSGGGGAANGGFVGQSASALAGGDGGNNRLNTGGGAAGTQTVLASAGTNGGGGGGSYASSTGGDFRRGSSGSMEVIWVDSATGLQAGPGAGGGGSRGLQIGGSGAHYGGGAGGFLGAGQGSGLIVITVLNWADDPVETNSWSSTAEVANSWQNASQSTNYWS